MTPERAAELVARWVRFYTRHLPAPIARRRIREIDADLHDHIVDARSQGISERRIAAGLLSRMTRGMAADVAWRRREGPLKGGIVVKFLLAVPVIALGVAAVVFGEGDDSPGAQLLGVLIVAAAVVWLVRSVRRGHSTRSG